MPASGRRRPGPVASITRDQILDAALSLGLGDIAMRDIADHLGVSVQTLYHYVGNREALLALAADRTVAGFVFPSTVGLDWPAWMRATALEVHDRLVDHPGVAAVALTGGARSGGVQRMSERLVTTLMQEFDLPPVFVAGLVPTFSRVVLATIADHQASGGDPAPQLPGLPSESELLTVTEKLDIALDIVLNGAQVVHRRDHERPRRTRPTRRRSTDET
ncbi:MAG: TetR/AcrR family transcriptional regulator [Dermatophilaceae bacterium]